MLVKLLEDWEGHKAGTVANLEVGAAIRLLKKGTAVSASERRDFAQPPKDKMIRRAKVRK